jgi:hypothetical protein
MVQKQLKHVRGWIRAAHPPPDLVADALRLSALRLFTLFLNGYLASHPCLFGQGTTIQELQGPDTEQTADDHEQVKDRCRFLE